MTDGVSIVPTLGQWAIIHLGMILCIFGVSAARQKEVGIFV